MHAESAWSNISVRETPRQRTHTDTHIHGTGVGDWWGRRGGEGGSLPPSTHPVRPSSRRWINTQLSSTRGGRRSSGLLALCVCARARVCVLGSRTSAPAHGQRRSDLTGGSGSPSPRCRVEHRRQPAAAAAAAARLTSRDATST